MRENLTHTIEDYLKTIFDITKTQDRASTNQIADALNITPASVTGMIKKLSNTEPPLVDYQRHRGVVLTQNGKSIALEIIRHHRLLEMFLHQMLGYEWDEVHAEADRLEHVISEEFEERIAAALGNPAYDPHGDPIPTRDLHLPDITALPLAKLRPGQSAAITRVSDSDPKLLRHLRELGMVPGARLEVIGFSPFDENLTLQISGENVSFVLGSGITKQIFVDTQPATTLAK